MLYRHLTKSCFKGDAGDNLMSWSSSLLFVIQYAIWRCRRRQNCDPADVKICMVDTRKFPRGQFARDISLLQAYRNTPELTTEMQNFLNLRLDGGYDNGEYLSQGVLLLDGRSSVTTLAQLIKSGLHTIYLEFKDPVGRGSWTNRVKDLRQKWATERRTSATEICTAIDMAKSCFGRFKVADVALLLLSLKNRTLSASALAGIGGELQDVSSECGPIEVHRYMVISEEMEILADMDLGVPAHFLSDKADRALFFELFECKP